MFDTPEEQETNMDIAFRVAQDQLGIKVVRSFILLLFSFCILLYVIIRCSFPGIPALLDACDTVKIQDQKSIYSYLSEYEPLTLSFFLSLLFWIFCSY
jgi:hypothetical protein